MNEEEDMFFSSAYCIFDLNTGYTHQHFRFAALVAGNWTLQKSTMASMDLLYSVTRKQAVCGSRSYDFERFVFFSLLEELILLSFLILTIGCISCSLYEGYALCNVSSQNVVAFVTNLEVDDVSGKTWGSHVYVADLNTPWNVCKYVLFVS